jgi:4-oxalocrotonate tautomerase
MPIIEMHLLEGRSAEKKRKAVAAMTAALVEALEVPAETVRILITEHHAEHFSVAGVTVGQRNEAAAKLKHQ